MEKYGEHTIIDIGLRYTSLIKKVISDIHISVKAAIRKQKQPFNFYWQNINLRRWNDSKKGKFRIIYYLQRSHLKQTICLEEGF